MFPLSGPTRSFERNLTQISGEVGGHEVLFYRDSYHKSISRPETVDADEDDLAYAIGRYALGCISIGKAAELAGVDRWTMIDVLEEAVLDTVATDGVRAACRLGNDR